MAPPIRHRRALRLLAAFAWAAALPGAALAQQGGAAPALDDSDLPAVVVADEILQDEALRLVTARGHVEIYQGERVLRAQQVTYDQSTDVVTAIGNVVVVEPEGDVIFADYAELTGDMKDGFVQNVSMRLADNSRLIANSGVRRNGTVLESSRGVYSPCEACAEHPDRPLAWQLRAASIRHDTATHEVVYRDAFLDLFGIPVLYTPYFSHPDPTVRRRSGLLTPVIGTKTELGLYGRFYYYLDIAPEADATFEVMATQDAGFLLGGEYRRRFTNGMIEVSGSVNQSDRIDMEGRVAVPEDDAFRWHVFGTARFDLNEHWRVGGDIARASDDTYLDIFDYTNRDVLTSHAFAEGFYGFSYALAEAFSFQDLRLNTVDQATIAPWLSFDYRGRPGAVLGGQLFGAASLLNLARDDESVSGLSPTEGIDTRRLSVAGGWHRQFYTAFGVVTSVSASLRGDLYWSSDFPDPDDADDLRSDVFAARLVPAGMVTASYPLVRDGVTTQQLIEPIVAVTATGLLGNEDDIPNNDSLDSEFDEVNLFSPSRLPGLDRVDRGLRFTYGVRAGIYGRNGGYGTVFLGQSYQIDGNDELPDETGIADGFSDLVGRITVAPGPWLNFDWRFRFDADDFSARRNEVAASGGIPEFRLRATYTFAEDLSGTLGALDREELTLGATSQISEFWRFRASLTRDLAASEMRNFQIGFAYLDECLSFTADLERDYTRDRDDVEGISLIFTLSLKNLGQARQSTDLGDLFSRGNDS